MSSDPTRFLDREDTGEKARRLLRAGSELRPPSELRAAMWASIACQLPPVGAPPPADQGPQGMPGDTAPPAPVPPSPDASAGALAGKAAGAAAKTTALKVASWLPKATAFKPFLVGVFTTATAVGVYHSSSPAPGITPAAVTSGTVPSATPARGAGETRAHAPEPSPGDDPGPLPTASAIAAPPRPFATASTPEAATARAPREPTLLPKFLSTHEIEEARPTRNDLPRAPAPLAPHETMSNATHEAKSEAVHGASPGVFPGAAAPTPPHAGVAPSPGPASQAAKASALLAESRALAEARAALRAGEGARALALLEAARARFGAGALAQEWRVLRIEALWALGRRGEAAGEAEAFLREYPASAHASRVLAFRGAR